MTDPVTEILAWARALSWQGVALLALTFAAWAAARRLWAAARGSAFLTPVLTAAVLIIGVLTAIDLPIGDYGRATTPLSAALLPATAAMAVPLWRMRVYLRAVWRPLVAGTIAGGATSFLGIFLIGPLLGLPLPDQLGLGLRAVTAPVAIPLAQSLGSTMDVTMLGILGNGLFGAMATPLLARLALTRLAGLRDDDRVTGFTLGLTSHAIGVAHAAPRGGDMAAMAAAGMLANAVCTTLMVIPLL
ncbi:LrgB family protein [uncultured Tistrella sp.]|uniref:LrgB family protein n=1 Tax=Tistrella mobilis TaxID=171437 RepID=UPI000C0AFBAD|nr:LrgB family protein [uncultured Tistrella sp.]MAM73678.1 effector of murein hydrolase [Tistrella sp.]